MKKETKLELETLLDNYEKKQTEAKIKQEEKQYELDLYLETFKEIREKVVRPVMVEIGEILEQKGHNHNIEEQEYSIDKKGFAVEAQIEFKVFPRGPEKDFYSENHPSLTFSSDTATLNVKVHGSYIMPERRGERELIRTYALSEINSNIVEKEILEILIKAFNG